MTVRAAIFAALILPLLSAATDAPRNPVLPGADPHVAVVCDRYWLYPTAEDGPKVRGRDNPRFHAYSSRDLTHWTRSAPLLTMADIGWIDNDGARRHYLWAPALAEANDKFYLYYSVGPQNPTPSRIGVAVADRPDGPFRDSGRPLLTGGNGFEAIDPMVYFDAKSGRTYLYAGGSAGAKLRVFLLKPGMTEIDREIPVTTPPHFTEGAFLHERDGTYYLSYSHGRWNDTSYGVHYATGPTPEGPWTYRGEILKSDALRKGPGHHAIFRNTATGAWFIAYHRWETRAARGPYRGSRRIAVQPLIHLPNGGIASIVMNNSPPPSAPIATPGCARSR